MDATRECAQIGCNEQAEFEITDLADNRPDTMSTDSCETHVGALIGHAMPWNGKNLGWRIDSINPL